MISKTLQYINPNTPLLWCHGLTWWLVKWYRSDQAKRVNWELGQPQIKLWKLWSFFTMLGKNLPPIQTRAQIMVEDLLTNHKNGTERRRQVGERFVNCEVQHFERGDVDKMHKEYSTVGRANTQFFVNIWKIWKMHQDSWRRMTGRITIFWVWKLCILLSTIWYPVNRLLLSMVNTRCPRKIDSVPVWKRSRTSSRNQTRW